MRIFALSLGCAASLCGQHRFNWQNYCFDHSASPVCPGHEYAIKKQPPSRDSAYPVGATNPFPPTPKPLTPSLIVVDGIDWRFADPSADALAGFNFKGLAASPLARGLIAQLGAKRGLTEADLQKLFAGLSGVDQVALSVRDNRMVVMVTGSVANSTLPGPETGLKAVPVSGNAMLIGHTDAVDQAMRRIEMKGALPEFTRLAQEQQASSEFWATGSAGMVGPQAVSAGVKRFSLTVSIRNRLTSDLVFEFNEAPSENTLRMLETTLGAATVEGNNVGVRTSMEADEVRQKFGQITASPVGERLATLVEAARYLPVPDTTVPRPAKPVIYGLDGGPKEVNQLPKR